MSNFLVALQFWGSHQSHMITKRFGEKVKIKAGRLSVHKELRFVQKLEYKVNRNILIADYSNHLGNAKGVTIPVQKQIFLNPSNTLTEMTTTLLFEPGHAQLHGLPGSKS